MALRASSRTCSSKIRRSLWLIVLLTVFVPVPAGLAQNLPRVAIECPAGALHPDRPFELNISVSWEGDAESHIIVPPEPVLPQGLTMRASSFETTVSDSHYRLTYRFILAARETGRFTIYPVNVLCWPRGSSKELSLLTDECCVTVSPAPWFPQKKIILPAASILLGIIAAVVLMRKKRSPIERP